MYIMQQIFYEKAKAKLNSCLKISNWFEFTKSVQMSISIRTAKNNISIAKKFLTSTIFEKH